MVTETLEHCPECGESHASKISNTPIWFECKTCGYYEDSFKGALVSLSRSANPSGPLVQYL